MVIRVGTRWHNMISDASTDSVASTGDSQTLTHCWTSRKSKISRAQVLKLKEPTWELDKAKVKAKARGAVGRMDVGCSPS